MAGESEDLPRVWVVGCATSVPGRTKEQGAQIIVDALHRAAQGEAVLKKAGRKGAWLNKCFIKTAERWRQELEILQKALWGDN